MVPVGTLVAVERTPRHRRAPARHTDARAVKRRALPDRRYGPRVLSPATNASWIGILGPRLA